MLVPALIPVRSLADALAGRSEPMVRWDHGIRAPIDTPGGPVYGWRLGSALAIPRTPHHPDRPRALMVFGESPDVEALLDQLAASFDGACDLTTPFGDQIGSITTERALAPFVRSRFSPTTGDSWNWLWTTTPPATTTAETSFPAAELVELDDTRDASAIRALNERGNPSAESRPGEGVTELWLGVRDGGRLVAAGASHLTAAQVPHLTGIVVDPEARRRGLGRAVVLGLTRAALQRYGVATLAMYASNEPAGALYESLGYHLAHRWTSQWWDTSTDTNGWD